MCINFTHILLMRMYCNSYLLWGWMLTVLKYTHFSSFSLCGNNSATVMCFEEKVFFVPKPPPHPPFFFFLYFLSLRLYVVYFNWFCSEICGVYLMLMWCMCRACRLPFVLLLESLSVCTALSTVFRSINSPDFAKKWRLQYNHWRKGNQLESTISQQNWCKDVERK